MASLLSQLDGVDSKLRDEMSAVSKGHEAKHADGAGKHKAMVDELDIPTDLPRAAGAPDKLQELQELHSQLEAELATERRTNAELRDAMQQEPRCCESVQDAQEAFWEYTGQLEERWEELEDRLAVHVEAEIESRGAHWRDCVNERQRVLADNCAYIAEQITAGSTGDCNSLRARFEHLESQLNAAMGDTGWTHIYDELLKLHDDDESQRDGMRELVKQMMIIERQADELRADLISYEQVHCDGRNRRR